MKFIAYSLSHTQFVVHRALLNEHKILHRDMSANNILVDPVHDPRTEDRDPTSGSDVPKFITDVLNAPTKACGCVLYLD